MISIFIAALWLQMSAPLDDIKPISEPNICRVVQVYKSGDIEDVVLTCIPNTLAEPVDVPAVQRHDEAEFLPNGEWPYTPKCPTGFHYGAYHSDEDWPSCEKYTYTCGDKSRILEHDENSPPKYWCRKVEF